MHDGSMHVGSMHNGSVHDGSVHDGSVHDGSVHNGSVHDGSVHVGSVHDGSMHDGSMHDARLTTNRHRSTLARGGGAGSLYSSYLLCWTVYLTEQLSLYSSCVITHYLQTSSAHTLHVHAHIVHIE